MYQLHYKVGYEVGKRCFSKLYTFGEYSKQIKNGAIDSGMPIDNIFINEDINNPNFSACDIKKNHFPNELILFKASNKANLYRILNILQNQGKDE